jgi:hypothetical protein
MRPYGVGWRGPANGRTSCSRQSRGTAAPAARPRGTSEERAPVRACVCACVRARAECVHACVRASACVRVRACVRASARVRVRASACMRVRACECVRASARVRVRASACRMGEYSQLGAELRNRPDCKLLCRGVAREAWGEPHELRTLPRACMRGCARVLRVRESERATSSILEPPKTSARLKRCGSRTSWSRLAGSSTPSTACAQVQVRKTRT